MFNVLVIILSLSSGNAAPTIASHSVTTQNMDGSYTVRYSSEHSTHAPKRDAAHFAADEGNNGTLPMVERKSL